MLVAACYVAQYVELIRLCRKGQTPGSPKRGASLSASNTVNDPGISLHNSQLVGGKTILVSDDSDCFFVIMRLVAMTMMR